MNPVISVLMVTCNHERYIRQAIESVVGQRTRYSLELVIADDASTDGTEAICREYAERYPQVVRYHRHSRSIGFYRNAAFVLGQCGGRYVALLDGDGYWTSLDHLEQRIEFLEKNPGVSLSFARAQVVDAHGQVLDVLPVPPSATPSFTDLLAWNFVSACTAIYRLDRRVRFDCLEAMRYPDYFLHLIHAARGAMHFHDQQVAASRRHAGEGAHAMAAEPSRRELLEFYLAMHRSQTLPLAQRPQLLERALQMAREQLAIDDAQPTAATSAALEQLLAPLQAFESVVGRAASAYQFTIILTTFNRPELLVHALDSLAQQSFQDFEVILVNDCGEPVDALTGGYDFPITSLRLGRNSGISAARNAGLRLARGACIAYLDDDDVFLPDHLERHARAHAAGERVVYSDSIYVLEQLGGEDRHELSRENSPEHDDFSRAALLVQNFIPVNAWTHPRHCLESVGGFDEGLPALEDWDMLLRLSAHFAVEHLKVHTVQVHMRQESLEQSLSRRERKNFPQLFGVLYERHTAESEGGAAQRQAFLLGLQREQEDKIAVSSRGYQQWLADDRAQVLLQRLGRVQRLEVLVVAVPGTTPQQLADTLGSLDAQQSIEVARRVVSAVEEESDLAFWQRFRDAAATSEADWICLLTAGDCLVPHAALIVLERIQALPTAVCLYVDEDSGAAGRYAAPIFKPDFNLDLLRSYPYTGRVVFVRCQALQELGGLDAESRELAAQDLQFRCAEAFGLGSVGHIAEVLYHAGTPYAEWLSDEAVRDLSPRVSAAHLQRLGVPHRIEEGVMRGINRVRYLYDSQPLVSILIPTRDQLPILQRCVESIFELTKYQCFEVLIIDNNSQQAETKAWLAGIEQLDSEQIRVLRYPHEFNFSAINNFAASAARGEFLVLLNNDTAIVDGNWLDELLNHGRRPEVGIVGAKLHYPDGKIQHAGVVLGMNGPADHPFIGAAQSSAGYMQRLVVDQNYSAVTAACLLIRRDVYEAVGGMDEQDFKVSYNDVDLCLKVGATGYLIVWAANAILLHEGSVSQKTVDPATQQAKRQRFQGEQQAMYRKWLPLLAHDPAYNHNLSLEMGGFVLDDFRQTTWQPLVEPLVPRILALPADNSGCGHYRVRQPMRALVAARLVDGVFGDILPEPIELERLAPQSVVFQRQFTDAQLEAIEHLQFNRPFKVYELDDYMPNLPLKSHHRALMPKDILKSIRRALRSMDRFVVSTEPLAEAFAGLHVDLRVQPNLLPPNWWLGLAGQRRVGRKPRVGWAGGVSHSGDLELIADVVRELADEVEWVFLGMCPERVRPYIHEFHPGVSIEAYPARLASLNLDLALAPLEDNQFNACKSNLRLLEYGACGYPVVCSDIVSYRGDLPVMRVRNRFKEWVDAIRQHITDLDAAACAGDELKQAVLQRWMLDGDNLQGWLKAWLPD